MKTLPSPRMVRKRGLTLIELTVVVFVLMFIVAILFIGANGWKRGTDRATCVLKIRDVQVAARSYQNMYGYAPGGLPHPSGGTRNIAKHLFDKGFINQEAYDSSQGIHRCPSGGDYSTPMPEIFPQVGSLYMECSLSGSSDHVPQTHADW